MIPLTDKQQEVSVWCKKVSNNRIRKFFSEVQPSLGTKAESLSPLNNHDSRCQFLLSLIALNRKNSVKSQNCSSNKEVINSHKIWNGHETYLEIF